MTDHFEDDDDFAPQGPGYAGSSYLRKIREHLELTQREMSTRLGMSLRAYSDLETGNSECRQIHVLAAERVALQVAKQRESPKLVPPSVRHDAMIFKRAMRPA